MLRIGLKAYSCLTYGYDSRVGKHKHTGKNPFVFSILYEKYDYLSRANSDFYPTIAFKNSIIYHPLN